MFKPVGRPSGPSEWLKCETCGTTFEVDRMAEKNTIRILTWMASDNRGGQKLAPWLAPKCPKCGAHRPADG
jgi:hypothetical protein